MIHHPENESPWLDILGVVIILLLPVVVAAVVILTGIGAYTVFTWLV